MSFLRWFKSFPGIVATLGVLASLAIALGPLVREQIALRTWTRIPCQVEPDERRFHFFYKGRRYYNARKNFWDAHPFATVPAADNESITPNDFCYVTDGSPVPKAVLHLDAAQHLDQGIGFFTAAGMVLAGTAGLIFLNSRLARKKSHAPAPQPPAAPPDLS